MTRRTTGQRRGDARNRGLPSSVRSKWHNRHQTSAGHKSGLGPRGSADAGLSGIDVCKKIRAAGITTSLIVLSAIGDEMDKVLLLEIGANDYVRKAVRQAGTARAHPRDAASFLNRRNRHDRLWRRGRDVTRRMVKKEGKEINLTRAEYNLLTYFIPNPNQALTRHYFEFGLGG